MSLTLMEITRDKKFHKNMYLLQTIAGDVAGVPIVRKPKKYEYKRVPRTREDLQHYNSLHQEYLRTFPNDNYVRQGPHTRKHWSYPKDKFI
jgi:hypothetical protein